MRVVMLLVFLLAGSLACAAAAGADPVYAPLWLYQGTWQLNAKDAPAGGKPEELKNQCALVGRFFVCQQTVNGVPGSLLIFVPDPNKPGHYYTQSVVQEGRATGRGDLEISGDRWVYSSRWDQGGGKATYYRTTNDFVAKNRIHYEQSESPDGKDWKVTNSGDEVRVSSSGR